MKYDPKDALLPGKEIAGYRIVRTIGAGRSGITYEALSASTGQRYAIKEFFPTGRASRQSGGQVIFTACEADVVTWALDRLECWTKELCQLRHPNIVEIFHYVKENNTGYVFMEYVDGATFESWLHAQARPPASPELKPVLEPVLDAVAYLHKMGHIHRDIAPKNIMIRPDGRPVLIDFGALKVIGKRTNPLRLFETRQPSYLSPEQLEDNVALDRTADIYALGGVLYRAFARVPPLDAEKRMRAVDVTGHDPYVPVARATRIDLAAEIASVIDRSLDLRSKDRPQSVIELRKALRWDNEGHTSPELANGSQAEAEAAPAGIDHSKSFHPESQDDVGRTREAVGRANDLEGLQSRSRSSQTAPAARTPRSRRWGLSYGAIATMAFVVVAIFAAGAILKGSSDDKAPADVSDNNKIIQDAFGRAKASGTIAAWDGFLQQFPSGPLADEARRERTIRFAAVREAFNRAKARDTSGAWDELLREFPDVDAEQVRLEREKKLMQKVFGRAKAAGTIPAWDGFLQQFPSGPLADEARRERQKLDFARREKEAFDLAKAADTIPAWNEFLRQFPSRPLADEARRERQKLALANRTQECPTEQAGRRGFVVERGDQQKSDVFHGDDGIVRTVMRYNGTTLLETTQYEGLFQLDRLDQGKRTKFETRTNLKRLFPLKPGQTAKVRFTSESGGLSGLLVVEIAVKGSEDLYIGPCKFSVLKVEQSESRSADPPRFVYTAYYSPALKLILAKEYRYPDGRTQIIKFDRIYSNPRP